MNIAIDVRCAHEVPDIGHLEEFCRYALTQQGVPDTAELSVSFVDDAEIAELNARWRHIEGPTDVLSFPMDEPDTPESMDEEVIPLGDIVIAPAVARRQATEFGSTFTEEVELLLAHGILHLLGYDHVEDDEAVEMENLERKILSGWRA
jgi:probable rRNA maturation factor